MIDLTQYVKDATRTESHIDTVTLDPTYLATVMQIFIASGNLLDQIKKNVFYGKPIEDEKRNTELKNVVLSLDQLNQHVNSLGQVAVTIAVDPRIFHAILGIATEATELMEALTLVFSTQNVDNINILEELGDLNWYEAIAIDALAGDFEQVLNANIEKLRARYPDKFDSNRAIHRNTESERTILAENIDESQKVHPESSDS